MEESESIKSEKNIESLSKYVLEDIFSFLPEKQKLEIIIYNKELKKQLDINIEDYKKIKGIYRIRERNGKGKEYNKNGELIFEGEYLNGKRNGKGKEYHENGELIFEGEYLNGKRWNGKGKDKEIEIKNGNGKGRAYYFDKLLFEGEYLNRERLKSNEYFGNGKLKFEGLNYNGVRWNGEVKDKEGNIVFEIKNGNGIRKAYYFDILEEYEGEYLNGKRNGKGKEYNKNGELIFEGEFLNGKKWNGKGEEYLEIMNESEY